MTQPIELCVACQHDIGMHFQAVDGKVRCLCAWTTESTSGVMGLISDHRCDCIDYHSEADDSQRAASAEAKRRDQELYDSIRNSPAVKKMRQELGLEP